MVEQLICEKANITIDKDGVILCKAITKGACPKKRQPLSFNRGCFRKIVDLGLGRQISEDEAEAREVLLEQEQGYVHGKGVF